MPMRCLAGELLTQSSHGPGAPIATQQLRKRPDGIPDIVASAS